MVRRLQLLLLGLLFALSGALVTGCNTVEGAGEDIKAAGEAIEEEAEEHQ